MQKKYNKYFLDACARLPIAVLGVGVLTQGKKGLI